MGQMHLKPKKLPFELIVRFMHVAPFWHKNVESLQKRGVSEIIENEKIIKFILKKYSMIKNIFYINLKI